jgi:hypothetical protein
VCETWCVKAMTSVNDESTPRRRLNVQVSHARNVSIIHSDADVKESPRTKPFLHLEMEDDVSHLDDIKEMTPLHSAYRMKYIPIYDSKILCFASKKLKFCIFR